MTNICLYKTKIIVLSKISKALSLFWSSNRIKIPQIDVKLIETICCNIMNRIFMNLKQKNNQIKINNKLSSPAQNPLPYKERALSLNIELKQRKRP